MILMHQYLPDLPAQMTSKQLSDNYLHYYGGNRRYAGTVSYTHLDVYKRQELKDNGLTIFLTSHFMDEVEALCDEIWILKKGKAVFYGTVEQAKKASGCEKFEDAYLMLLDVYKRQSPHKTGESC